MNKHVKNILLVAGSILLIYGIYTLIAPETSVGIGDFKIETQNNTNSYITIGLGLAAVALSFLARKKS
ncbi:MAG: LPXTG cell wall anchor domain-containing protein [Flavobacteriaceae bacterium]